MTLKHLMTRRSAIAAGAGVLAAGIVPRTAAALATVRQGYQTNLWGMPTYYLLHSGLLEKHGIAAEEFAVPSGNLTMQQMVARQVDLGTYAGPSFVLGNARGGLVAIAVIEHVARSIRIMARKDLGLTKIEQLKGLKVANQTGSSVGDIFVGTIAPAAGLKKGDWRPVYLGADEDRYAPLLRRIWRRDRRREAGGDMFALFARRENQRLAQAVADLQGLLKV